MMIKSSTSIYALIGNPIHHSLSPIIQNAAFKYLGVDSVYLSFRVEEKQLDTAIKGMKSLGFLGFNVTMPYKMAILDLIDILDDNVSIIGAVNTVAIRGGKLFGYNTDGEGAKESLKECGSDPVGRSILLLGAGGAARSIAYSLVPIVRRLSILNRTIEKAKRLSKELERTFKKPVFGGDFEKKNFESETQKADIIINATPIGMYPKTEETLIDSEFLRPGITVLDLVYDPLETLFLREAKNSGAKTINGLRMLIHQAALAFRIWTNLNPPIDVMFDVALKEVKSHCLEKQ